MDEERVNK
jgi:hypothetical protein